MSDAILLFIKRLNGMKVIGNAHDNADLLTDGKA